MLLFIPYILGAVFGQVVLITIFYHLTKKIHTALLNHNKIIWLACSPCILHIHNKSFYAGTAIQPGLMQSVLFHGNNPRGAFIYLFIIIFQRFGSFSTASGFATVTC